MANNSSSTYMIIGLLLISSGIVYVSNPDKTFICPETKEYGEFESIEEAAKILQCNTPILPIKQYASMNNLTIDSNIGTELSDSGAEIIKDNTIEINESKTVEINGEEYIITYVPPKIKCTCLKDYCLITELVCK